MIEPRRVLLHLDVTARWRPETKAFKVLERRRTNLTSMLSRRRRKMKSAAALFPAEDVGAYFPVQPDRFRLFRCLCARPEQLRAHSFIRPDERECCLRPHHQVEHRWRAPAARIPAILTFHATALPAHCNFTRQRSREERLRESVKKSDRAVLCVLQPGSQVSFDRSARSAGHTRKRLLPCLRSSCSKQVPTPR